MTPQLKRLAHTYTADDRSGRVVVIRRLLDDAMTARHQTGPEADARFVRGPPSTPKMK